MTRPSANFLLALLNHNAGANLDRTLTAADVAANIDLIPDSITRKDLIAFWAQYTPLVGGRPLGAGPSGPLSRSLRWPSWLTEDPTVRTTRGTFMLPKSDLVEWMIDYENEAAAAIATAQAKAEAKATRAAEKAAKAIQRAADRAAAKAVREAAKALKAQNAAAAATATPAPAATETAPATV